MKLFPFIFVFIFGIEMSCQTPTNTVDAETFRVKITHYYFGGIDSETLLTQDSINAVWNKTINETKTYSRRFTVDEKMRVKQFMSRFPILAFKEKYINEQVKDGTQLRFEIYIGSTSKNIFVSNYYIKELGALTDLINTLVPVDYIGYNRISVPREIQ
jgi:muconolactone delta-isomerase